MQLSSDLANDSVIIDIGLVLGLVLPILIHANFKQEPSSHMDIDKHNVASDVVNATSMPTITATMTMNNNSSDDGKSGISPKSGSALIKLCSVPSIPPNSSSSYKPTYCKHDVTLQ